MRAKLLCKTGALAGQTHQLSDDNVIGRSVDADVPLASSLISGRHARIFGKQGSFYLEDLGSANGTWLDGVRITGPVRLDGLNVITFAGRFDFLFHLVDAESRREPAKGAPVAGSPGAGADDRTRVPSPPAIRTTQAESLTRAAPADFEALPELRRPGAREAALGPTGTAARSSDVVPQESRTRAAPADFEALPELRKQKRVDSGPAAPAPRPPEAPPQESRTRAAPADFEALPELRPKPSARYALEVAFADGTRQTFELHDGPNTLGRAADCDVTIGDLLVSRRHAVLTVGESVVLEDTGSGNGIRIHGKKVARAELEAGATFRLAPNVEATLARK